MDEAIGGHPSVAGVDISGNTALNFSAVFNAVQVISGTIASLPFILYQRIGENGKERAINHPLYDALHNQPNPEMTSYVFRETLQAHLLLQGNAFAEIIRDKTGRTVELWPWNPQKVEIKRAEDKKLYYTIDEGKGQKRTLPAQDVLHIPGLGYDGRIGYAVVTKARESMGLGLGMEEFQARFYGQGTNVGGVLEHPGRLSDEAHKRLKKDIEEKYSGLSKSHKTMILEEGMKLTPGMPLEDAQFLESRVFQIGEVARWFNTPPPKLQDLSKATYSNIEKLQLAFTTDTIRPWAVRWEQHISWKLLSLEERKIYFAEFLLDAIQRGDIETRMKAYSHMRNIGAINADEIRAKENMNPIGGLAGETYWKPLNMGDADKEEKPPEPKKKGQPVEEPSAEEEKKLRAVK